MEKQLSYKLKLIKALRIYTFMPLSQLLKKSNKELLFHLENFCLICNDNFNQVKLINKI